MRKKKICVEERLVEFSFLCYLKERKSEKNEGVDEKKRKVKKEKEEKRVKSRKICF